MASSGSNPPAAAAGLHGGSTCIDLTDDNDDLDGPTLRRCHGAIMDDGSAYPGRTPVSNGKIKQHTQNGHGICIIDLVSGPESDEEDDGSTSTTKKRSLQRKNDSANNDGSPQKSSPIRKRRTTRQLNNDRMVPRGVPTYQINLPSWTTRDCAKITFGLLSLIDLLKGKDTLTCEGSLASSNSKLFKPLSAYSMPPALPVDHQPFHYLQNDDWSCGFRNLQMLISSMMPTINPIFPEGIPSVEDIQRTMEVLWSRGFDLRNAKHHKHSLVGKKSWIGTVEVWSYLSFMRVDSIIVQFIKTKDKRAMLGNFVWAYFSRACGTVGCSCRDNCHGNALGNPLATPTVNSSAYASALLKSISNPENNNHFSAEGEKPVHRCKCAIPPLYLQWDGHSVTIVGVKRICGGNNAQPPSFNLIIFCPMKEGATIKNILAKELTNRNTAGEPPAVESKLNDKFVKSVIELPVSKLLDKDCQVLLSTARIITEGESNARKNCTKYIGFHNAGEPAK